MNEPKVSSIEISPPLDGFTCGRCLQLHQGAADTIPQHTPSCPMREERARAWDDGWECGVDDEQNSKTYSSSRAKNPHR